MHLQDTLFSVVKWLKYCRRGTNTKQQHNQRFPQFGCVIGNDGRGMDMVLCYAWNVDCIHYTTVFTVVKWGNFADKALITKQVPNGFPTRMR